MGSGFKVQRDQNGMPLQDFLAAQLGLSRRKAKERIDARLEITKSRDGGSQARFITG